MLITVDNRESDLYNSCKMILESYEDINIVKRQLPLGDATIFDASDNELIIIERKTLYDLASSIKDGRYAEQSYRLNECEIHNHQIYYLIEGDMNSYNATKGRMERKSLISAFTTISYYKGFSIHKTNSIIESAEWLICFADKLRRQKGVGFYDDNKDASKSSSYACVSSREKKANINIDNIDIIMLSQIPGVSVAVASAILKMHLSLENIIFSLRENLNALDNIFTETKTGKPRKIPKNSIANIVRYLHIDK